MSRHLIAKGVLRIGSVSVEEALTARLVYLCNAVVGLVEVELVAAIS